MTWDRFQPVAGASRPHRQLAAPGGQQPGNRRTAPRPALPPPAGSAERAGGQRGQRLPGRAGAGDGDRAGRRRAARRAPRRPTAADRGCRPAQRVRRGQPPAAAVGGLTRRPSRLAVRPGPASSSATSAAPEPGQLRAPRPAGRPGRPGSAGPAAAQPPAARTKMPAWPGRAQPPPSSAAPTGCRPPR